ncbi:4632_t:CDS:2 [Acaulospora colombiana]|uniref:4632_t:CDS:1 n=1 Tax=Acaulospora colombiana TaxID=27376 RepID=A0ACA9K8Q4_9GLOM|nr:4632_t:CDS:2 [Acaulospora colombiana]
MTSKHNSKQKKARIVLLLEEGYITREIAKRKKVSLATVSRTGKRKSETESLED